MVPWLLSRESSKLIVNQSDFSLGISKVSVLRELEALILFFAIEEMKNSEIGDSVGEVRKITA